MKIKILFFLLFITYNSIYSQVLEQTIYVDFGPTGGTNGGITINPDSNSNYWNNPTNGALGSSTSLISANNTNTNYQMNITDSFVVNTGINYGPTAPTSANLGDLAISSATQDYFYLETGGSVNPTGQITLMNLDVTKAYKYYIFASRPTSSVRISNFVFSGSNSYSNQLQTSDGSTGNLNTILTTPYLYPDGSGNITIDVSIVQGGFAYINAMKIEEYTVSTIDVTSISVDGNDITVSGQTSQIVAVISPSNATSSEVTWTVDNEAIAAINTNGILTPVNNGSVTVTATSVQNPTISDSKIINISNQLTTLYFSGTATENGDNPSTSIPMKMVTNLTGTVSNIYEVYTSLNANGTFNFYTSQDSNTTIYGSDSGTGTIALNGSAIDPQEVGPVLITVNLNSNTYTILPINWSVVGSTITNGWNGDEPLTYQSNGVWSATINMDVVTSDTNPRFVFKGNASWNYVLKRIQNTDNTLRMESQANTYSIPIEDIGLNYGVFNITLDLQNYTYSIECNTIDDLKISIMGSSVSNGQGATSNHGYAYKYGQLLNDRYSAGLGSQWTTSNLAVNGNNTVAVLNRWEKDLIGDCSKFVIYGLSLGNEGIHENGQPSFDQFNNNMLLLISKAEQAGKIPVIMNNYTRGDYNATDYNFIKQMNLLIHQWNVPSVNLLGAIDNGSGQWSTGYESDYLHPNDAGHTEFFYAMVPSLFDALELEKPLPQIITGTSITVNNNQPVGSLNFTPEHIIHPFTISFDIKTSASGNLLFFTNSTSTNGILSINSNGNLVYTSPSGSSITSTSVVNDNTWHKITLSHFYARGETLLYIDSNSSGNLSENLIVNTFTLNPSNAPSSIQYRNWLFYRSGMNTEEISALSNGQMLKSSLELYAPLDEQGITGNLPFINLAQSTNTIDSSTFLGTTTHKKTGYQYINPVNDSFIIYTDNIEVSKMEIYSTLGHKIKSIYDSKTIDMSNLSKGIYFVKIYADTGNSIVKVLKN